MGNLPVVGLVDKPLTPRASRFCAVRAGTISSSELLLTLLIVLDCHVLHASLRESAGWVCSRELAEA
ncbi:MAG: hypothetical protein EHM13_10390 [Acidobacteria bacterium]|nr:MAG: hypothetical protein EHM13_10390 [Acidobacteriota bacterium]